MATVTFQITLSKAVSNFKTVLFILVAKIHTTLHATTAIAATTTLPRFGQNKPSNKTELRFLVKYSKVLGIFLLKLAAEVESYMMRATSSGIPPGFTGLEDTSFFGDTCMCTSLMILPLVVTTSTRTKSASTVAFPRKGSIENRKKNKKKKTKIKHV